MRLMTLILLLKPSCRLVCSGQRTCDDAVRLVQPLRRHEHWHIDVAYLNLGRRFYYLCAILDGASRTIVHWEIREAMTEADFELVLLRPLEPYANELPRVIPPNG